MPPNPNQVQNTPSQSTKEMTYGEKAVGLTFNPSGDKDVQKVKELYAEIINILKPMLDKEPFYTEYNIISENGSLLEVAIREAQTAQMWAVKAITYKF